MKRLLLTLLFAACLLPAKAQKAMTFDEAKHQGISIPKLDSTYKSAIHNDSTLAVFGKEQDRFIEGYHNMLQALGKYLKAKGFVFQKPARGFNRIYFNASGGIDYYLFNFREDQLSKERSAEFERLLAGFIKDYRFPMKAQVPFAQCSPVTYMPVL